MMLNALIHRAGLRNGKPLIMQRLLELLDQYPEWDVWKTHPLCFLPPEEVTLIETFLATGSAQQLSQAVGHSVARLRNTMPLLEKKLRLGIEDYQRTMQAIHSTDYNALKAARKVVLQRPLPLLCNSLCPAYDAALWQPNGAGVGPSNLQELAGGLGLDAYLQELGFTTPPNDLLKVLQRFELHLPLSQAD